ncbi:hypothetical protein [Aureibacter tunicatorum]|uniref:Uncharacterized protein n=1 Tax=Aureibacter tunicatorum TaxID=866807 RepID=A0AAE3XU71_9BACT|nr:hypothetical protein [Aureibacter tunicatorum]MDR6242039.1 hypothetical protein [Aureibacter tunicatorum]BDD07117.1 hypothetical protein AUTU_46000 [Aureibacter tunicatorum]
MGSPNTLSIRKIERSDFDDPIDELFIDGIHINDILNSYIADFDTKYLLPSISCEMTTAYDKEFLWQKIDSNNKIEEMLPMLMCVEADFTCLEHIVFIHVEKSSEFVHWKKFGVISKDLKLWKPIKKNSDDKLAVLESIVSIDSIKKEHVVWIENTPEFKFTKQNYSEIINYYRKTNEDREAIDMIFWWLGGIDKSIGHKYIHIHVDSDKNIRFYKSFFKWKEQPKWKYTKYKLRNSHIISNNSKELLKFIKKAVERVNLQFGHDSILNQSSLIYISDDNEFLSLENKFSNEQNRN